MQSRIIRKPKIDKSRITIPLPAAPQKSRNNNNNKMATKRNMTSPEKQNKQNKHTCTK